MGSMTCAEASRLALVEEMRRDPTVWALGEDLGPEGGVAGQYKGLQEMFGPERIFDTPISESTIMGAAVGAAIAGTRPVVELRYCDLALCAADEIINQAAKMRYMTAGQCRVPVVIRQSIGLRFGSAAHHSQSTEALWTHVPGLVVVAPANAADTRMLLKAAIRSDDPVIFMEHKELFGVAGEVPEAESVAELGKARRVREGRDVTIVAWSAAVRAAAAAATMLEAEDISVELIDLRTLWPWDRATVFASVEKTGRLLVAHESVRAGGFGGEIVADVVQNRFAALKTAPQRVAAPRVTVPYAEPLERQLRVSPERIVAAVRGLLDSRPASSDRRSA